MFLKVNSHSIRFSYVFVRFFTFLLLLDKVCALLSAFLCVHIRTNQTVTYWTKVFRKNFFVKGCSSISKYGSYRSYTKFLNKIFIYITVYLVRIWTYKNANEKAHTFSRRSKNVKERTKTYEKRILCKFTFGVCCGFILCSAILDWQCIKEISRKAAINMLCTVFWLYCFLLYCTRNLFIMLLNFFFLRLLYGNLFFCFYYGKKN